MKKSLFGILFAATALMPAAAMAQEHHEGGREGGRPARAAPQARPAPQARVAPQTRAAPLAEPQVRSAPQDRVAPQTRAAPFAESRAGGPGVRAQGRPMERGDYLRRVPAGGAWSRNWRQDQRYNWSNYRNYNRGLFRLRPYDVPYGWGYGYRRFSVGMTLMSMLFSENYWISDPYYYRLPPVYGPYRWVRYYNDALLIDVRTGMVVDTAYNIFW